jgi:LPXTG-motif cell wall-anchored protein
MIRYRFTTPEGIVKEDRSEVLLQNWSKLREGDAVNIEYLPATGDSRITGQTSSAPVFLVIGAVLLAGGWFLRRRKSPRPSGEGS